MDWPEGGTQYSMLRQSKESGVAIIEHVAAQLFISIVDEGDAVRKLDACDIATAKGLTGTIPDLGV